MTKFNMENKLTSKNSISEPDLATAGRPTPRSGFPPGITVDELWLYRRKRPSANLWPDDNLRLREGSFKNLKTEYKRRFKNFYDFGSAGDLRKDISPVRAGKPEDSLKVEGFREFRPLYSESFVEYPVEVPSRWKPVKSLLHLEGDFSVITEKQEKFVQHELQRRPPLVKKHTNLNIEGQLDLLPEYRKEFIEYKAERPKLALPVDNLTTDGFFDLTSEVPTPFEQLVHPQIPHLRESEEEVRVRVPARKRESLRLEGRMESETENKSQFVEKFVPRTDRTRISNNLQLEGRIDLNPEYRNAYIDFGKDGRTSPSRIKSRRLVQDSSLKGEGKMETRPEYSCSYVDFPRRRPQLRRPECSSFKGST